MCSLLVVVVVLLHVPLYSGEVTVVNQATSTTDFSLHVCLEVRPGMLLVSSAVQIYIPPAGEIRQTIMD